MATTTLKVAHIYIIWPFLISESWLENCFNILLMSLFTAHLCGYLLERHFGVE